MKILLLSQIFDPEPNIKGLVFAKALAAAGHEVEVLTGFPNYPGGKVYPGYRIKFLQREVMDGIKVTRVPLYPDHSTSSLGRILNYGSFAATSCIYGLFMAKKFDVIYVYTPPMTTAMSAAIISFFRRKPFVYDIQDIWPDTLRATGFVLSDRLLNCIGRCCKFLYKRAAHIVGISPGFKERLLQRGVSAQKISVIYNWCDEQALQTTHQVDLQHMGLAGRFNLVFAGNMGKAQALDNVMLAAKQVAAVNPSVQFVFVGGGIEVECLKRFIKEQEISNVIFLPRMPMNEIGTVLQAADVLLVHLKDDPLFEITIPSKTQAYMAMAKPILMAVKGNAAELIQQADAGYCAEPENIDSIVKAVLAMAALPSNVLQQMGQNGKYYYTKHLSLQVGVRQTIAVLQQVVKI